VDDFGVKYVGREHAEHLMACIKKNYEISSDWKGSAYCGLTLKWDYNNRTVDLSMPGYIKAALHKYQHPAPILP
jgi:endonuclease I